MVTSGKSEFQAAAEEFANAQENPAQLQDAQMKALQDARIASILTELNYALDNLLKNSESYSIFLGTTGLIETEQVALLQTLGEGDIHITMSNTDEPIEWYETLYPGIWVGTHHNHRGEAILRTIEVNFFPEIAKSQPYDIQCSIKRLQEEAEMLTQGAE